MESILIIDDEAQIRSMIRLILERDGYVVTEAPDGTEGIRQFREKPTDLIITDIIMPNKDGIGMIIELKKSSPASRSSPCQAADSAGPMAICAGPSNSAPPAPCPNRSTARSCCASSRTPSRESRVPDDMIRPCLAYPYCDPDTTVARIGPICLPPPAVDVRADRRRARISKPFAASEAMPVQFLRRMSSPRRQIVRSAALLLAVASTALLGAQRAGADIVHFKDGMKTVCQGKAWEEKDEVRCEYGGGVLIYSKADVQTIERRPDPVPPASAPGKYGRANPGPASKLPGRAAAGAPCLLCPPPVRTPRA
ncbi:MAG: response regulator [Desulfobacterales bacterium]|nr:response regulator [Desulfobacterales bacterium]